MYVLLFSFNVSGQFIFSAWAIPENKNMLALNNNALLHDIFVSVIAIQKPMLIAGF
jgi:hypothetical protein